MSGGLTINQWLHSDIVRSLYEGILVHSQKNCFWMPTSQDLHALNVLML